MADKVDDDEWSLVSSLEPQANPWAKDPVSLDMFEESLDFNEGGNSLPDSTVATTAGDIAGAGQDLANEEGGGVQSSSSKSSELENESPPGSSGASSESSQSVASSSPSNLSAGRPASALLSRIRADIPEIIETGETVHDWDYLIRDKNKLIFKQDLSKDRGLVQKSNGTDKKSLKWISEATYNIYRTNQGEIRVSDGQSGSPRSKIGKASYYYLYDISQCKDLETGPKGSPPSGHLKWRTDDGKVYERISEGEKPDLKNQEPKEVFRVEVTFDDLKCPDDSNDESKDVCKKLKEKAFILEILMDPTAENSIKTRRARKAASTSVRPSSGMGQPAKKPRCRGHDVKAEPSEGGDAEPTLLLFVLHGLDNERNLGFNDEVDLIEQYCTNVRREDVEGKEKFSQVLEEYSSSELKGLHIVGHRDDDSQTVDSTFMTFKDESTITVEDFVRTFRNWVLEKNRSGLPFPISFSTCSSEVIGRYVIEQCRGILQSVFCVRGLLNESCAHIFYPNLYKDLVPGNKNTLQAYYSAVRCLREYYEPCRSPQENDEIPLLIQYQTRLPPWTQYASSTALRENADAPDLPLWERNAALKNADAAEFVENTLKCATRRPLFLRNYQHELVDQILDDFESKRNTIVYLPTGTGKTAIAAQVITTFDAKLTVFVVPTVVLVYQQARALEEFTGLQVLRVCGGVSTSIWNKVACEFSVICITPEMLKNFLQKDYHRVAQDIGLLIVDECHHAHGKHPTNMILSWLGTYGSYLPCVGLTASFQSNKSATKFEEAILSVRGSLRLNGEKVHIRRPDDVPQPNILCKTILVEDLSQRILEEKFTNSAESAGFEHIIIEDEINYIRNLTNVAHNNAGLVGCGVQRFEGIKPILTPAVDELVRLLRDLGPNQRTLVFVERREEVNRLFRYLEDHCAAPELRPTYVTGTREQSWTDQLDAVNRFSSGSKNVLIGTSAIQEGFDIRDCKCVVLVAETTSLTKLIQCRGRARKEGARVFIIGTKKSIERYESLVQYEERDDAIIRTIRTP